MAEIRQNRVDAFTAWLRTIDGKPPFHQRPEFRFFADLTSAERAAADQIMRGEGEQLNREADRLEGAQFYVGAGCPPFLRNAIEDALTDAVGPVTVYGSGARRKAAYSDQVASAAISASWDELADATGIGPSREDHLQAALEILIAAQRHVWDRLANAPELDGAA